MRKAVFGGRALRNAVLDSRYGRPVVGSARTRFPERGSADIVNSDWGALKRIFDGRVGEEDVLVDVGCGRGRVLNYWLRNHPHNRLVGLELDPDVAASTRERLARFTNVGILAGDAVENLPDDGSLFFLFNPFDSEVLARLADRLEEPGRPERTRGVYYNAKHLAVFESRPRWSIELVDIGGGRWAPFSSLALLTLTTPDC